VQRASSRRVLAPASSSASATASRSASGASLAHAIQSGVTPVAVHGLARDEQAPHGGDIPGAGGGGQRSHAANRTYRNARRSSPADGPPGAP